MHDKHVKTKLLISDTGDVHCDEQSQSKVIKHSSFLWDRHRELVLVEFLVMEVMGLGESFSGAGCNGKG